MDTVFNIKNVNTLEQPMFLGEDLGLQRYDRFKHKVFNTLYQEQKDNYWSPQRFSMKSDKVDYENLSETEREIFLKNLKFQTVGDSLLSRTLSSISQHVTNPELEASLGIHTFMEIVHSESYTWIMQNLTGKPTEFFDSIYEDKGVMKRAAQLRDSFDKLLEPKQGDTLKDDIFKTVLSLNIAEGVLFYTSFVCSFWFGAQGKLGDATDIISLIRRDENLHLANTQNILNLWKNNPDEGFQETTKKNEALIYEAFRSAVEHEKEWGEYLFSHGSLMGLNEKILGNYSEFIANTRLRSLGYDQIFDTKKNPLGNWVDQYLKADETAVAPQEKSITEYKLGASINNLDTEEFDF